MKKNKVYNEDYKVLNKRIEDAELEIDILLTDVPYNKNLANWDSFNIIDYLKNVVRILKKDSIVGLWCTDIQLKDAENFLTNKGYTLIEKVIWQKTNSLSKIKEECCYIFKHNARISVECEYFVTKIEHSVNIDNRIHSCQKPLFLTDYIINRCIDLLNKDNRTYLFLDNFGGSNTNVQSLIKTTLFLRGNIEYLVSESHLTTYKKSLIAIENAKEELSSSSIVTLLEEECGYSRYSNVLTRDILEDLIKIGKDNKYRYSNSYKRVVFFYILYNFNLYRYFIERLLIYLNEEDKETAMKIAEEMCLFEYDGGTLSEIKYLDMKYIEKELDINKRIIKKYKLKILNGKKEDVSLATRRRRYALLLEDKDFSSSKDYAKKRKKEAKNKGNYWLLKYEEEYNLGIVRTKKEFINKYKLSKSTFYNRISRINDDVRY